MVPVLVLVVVVLAGVASTRDLGFVANTSEDAFFATFNI